MTFPVSMTKCTPGIYTSRFQGGERCGSTKPNSNDANIQTLTQLLAQLKTATIQKGSQPDQVRINGVLYGVSGESFPNNKAALFFLEEEESGEPLTDARSLQLCPKEDGLLLEDSVGYEQIRGGGTLYAESSALYEQYMAWAKSLIAEHKLQVRIDRV